MQRHKQKKVLVAFCTQKKTTKEKTKEHILYMQPAEKAIFQMSSAQNGLFAALNLFNNIKQEHLTI